MKRVISTPLAALALALFASPAMAQDGDPEIVYIDSQRILAEAPEARRARQAFEEELNRYREQLSELQRELQQMIEEYRQQRATLSAEARRTRQQEIREKRLALRERRRQLEQKIAQRQAELVRPVMERINDVIAEIRREEGYALIIDVAAGGVVAADPALDITDRVLERLRATASTDASTGSSR